MSANPPYEITLTAATEEELAEKLDSAARRMRTAAAGGNVKLDEMMSRRGLSDHTLGRLMGMTWTAVYYWRRGLRAPTRYSLGRLVTALKCSPAEIGFW